MKKQIVGLTIGLALAATLALPVSANETDEGTDVTIYNSNLVVVKERRKIALDAGVNRIPFENVAATIDPTSVRFESMTDPAGTFVEEQNYEYDLVNASKILDKYLDCDVTVITKTQQTYAGRLLSFDEANLVLADSTGGIQIIARGDNVQHITFGKLPEGLLVKPTLVWNVNAVRAGEHLVKVAYMAGGVGWHANYIAVLADDDQALDYSGWVTIDNRCGKTFENAKLKLIAGDVQRTPVTFERQMMRKGPVPLQDGAAFEQKQFFEYHMYTLPRPVTVRNNQTKQIELLNKKGVGCEKEYIYSGSGDKVDVRIKFKNSEDNSLGMPIPKGIVRLYKKDSDGNLEFVGEDSVDHTPKNEEIGLKVGQAFDIRVEKKLVETRKVSDRANEHAFEVKLKNRKDEKIVVIVRQYVAYNWRMLEENFKHEKKDALNVEWKIEVEPNTETLLKYRFFQSQ